MSSFAIRQRAPDTGCGPATAVREMPADGALLFMFEYRGPTRRDVQGWPRRPRRFVLDRRTLGTYECLGRSYMVRFADRRRVFQAHIYLGRDASGATRRRILGVLDSLRVGAPSPRAAAVWIAPSRLLSKTPYLGVACRAPNSVACDRVGLAVWLRQPAISVAARIDLRRMRLDDPRWSGPIRHGTRRLFAGFLHPAGLLRKGEVDAGVELTIRLGPRRFVRTSLVVPLAPGWG
ncbi:MAG: hypothetical protein QOF12_101 [Solirubrobacteraceae bacterium]|nr:hypothetical protein [Solirubrobacteraceae bacterium]